MDFENTSANMSEVAEQTEIQGEEAQEVAAPAEVDVDEHQDETGDTENNEAENAEEVADEQTGRTKQDAAFAEQRRRIEELEAEIAEMKEAEQQEKVNAEREAEKTEQLEAVINFAREQGYDDEEIEELIEEVMAEQEAEDEKNALIAERDALQDRLLELEVENTARSDLKTLQEIDPDLNDLDELGDEFFVLRAQGIEPARAYHMIKSADEKMKPKGAYAPGRINKAKQESDYYTSEELDNLTDEEIDANWEKVKRSMNRL